MVKLKKGFTLIELLAVIIILAIVALIATPVVLNIVEQSRESIRKLAVSNLANAIKQSVDNHYLKSGGQMPDITIEWIYDKDNIDYPENNVMCTDVNFDKNGALYLYNCQVDNYEKTYCYENGQVLSGNECYSDITYTDASCFEFDDSTGTITGYNYDGDTCATDIVIPNTINNVPVEHIGYVAFVDEVIFQVCIDDEDQPHEVDPNYVHYDGDGYQYCGVNGFVSNPITSVILPENIVTIGGWAFLNNQLTEIKLSDLPNLTTISMSSFASNQISTLALEKLPNLMTINVASFVSNQISTLTLKELPNLTTIGIGSFAGNQLVTLTISNLPNLTTIDYGAFAINQLNKVTLSNLSELVTIGKEVFNKNVEMLSNLNLTTIKNFTGKAFDWADITGSYTYNQIFEGGTVIHQDGNIEVITDEQSSSDEEAGCFDFDSSTGTITGYNYDGNKCTTDVVIPNKINDVVVEYIGYAAFIDEITYQRCADDEYQLHEVDPNYVHYDGDGYQYCLIEGVVNNPITSVILPENLVTIDDWAFGGSQLTEIKLRELPNLTKIGVGSFVESQLSTLTLRELPNLTTIDYLAFGCNGLTELTLSNLPELAVIGEGAFGENNLTELVLTDLPSLTTIGIGSFADNQLVSLTLSELPSLTTIDMGAFSLNELSTLTLSNLPKLAIIGEDAFAYNELTEITLSVVPNLTTNGIKGGAFIKDAYYQSNLNLIEIKNFTGTSFDWSSITGSNTNNQIFETGTIIHQDGNIEVINE